jgi:hypothetical protein
MCFGYLYTRKNGRAETPREVLSNVPDLVDQAFTTPETSPLPLDTSPSLRDVMKNCGHERSISFAR